MSPRTGRPRLSDEQRRDDIQRFRTTGAESVALAAAAERAGLSLGDWLRKVALAAARRQR